MKNRLRSFDSSAAAVETELRATQLTENRRANLIYVNIEQLTLLRVLCAIAFKKKIEKITSQRETSTHHTEKNCSNEKKKDITKRHLFLLSESEVICVWWFSAIGFTFAHFETFAYEQRIEDAYMLTDTSFMSRSQRHMGHQAIMKSIMC